MPTTPRSVVEGYERAVRQFPPHHRVELVNGRIVVNDAATRQQTEIISTLLKSIVDRVVEDGWTIHTNVTVFLGAQGDRYVPDLAIVPRRPRMRGADVIHGEDTHLVVDVVAACSVHDDHVTKPREHARAGVPLYLVIDPEPGTATLFCVPAEDGYQKKVQVTLGTPLHLPDPWKLTLDTGLLLDSGVAKTDSPA